MVRPALTSTSTVTGTMAMRMGSSIAPISAQSSMTPAAAGTNSSGKMPVRNRPYLLDLLELHDAEAERRQQQQQAVDAGRDGEGQQGVTDLAQKTEREDARELKQIVRRDASFGLKETRDYIMEYKSTV